MHRFYPLKQGKDVPVCVDKLRNMMQAAPSLPWPPKPEDLLAPDRQPPKSLTSFLEQLLQSTHHTTGEMVK